MSHKALGGRCTPWAMDETGGTVGRQARSSRMSERVEEVGYDGRARWIRESMAAHWLSVSTDFQERGGEAVTVIMRYDDGCSNRSTA